MKNILMNIEMTKALLDGRKVQMRRVIKYGYYAIPNDMNEHSIEVMRNYCDLDKNNNLELKSEMIKHAKYQIDETIWVREPARVVYYYGSWTEDYAHIEYLADNHVIYHWDEFPENPKSWLWDCKGIPNGCCKSLARIFLKITNVRVERLHDITLQDIYFEGIFKRTYMVDHNDDYSYRSDLKDFAYQEFRNLWNKTAPKNYKWEDNPYVFVYEFERVDNEYKIR